jgi:hypothetical protein
MMVGRFIGLVVWLVCAALVVSCGADQDEAVVESSSGAATEESSLTTGSVAAASSAEDPVELLELVDYGFSIYSTGDNGGRSWAVILENRSEMTAVDVAITVGFTSLAEPPPVSGTALPHAPEAVDRVSETEVIPYVPPGRSAWSREQSGGSLNMGPEHVWSVSVAPPVEMDVEVEIGGWREVAEQDGPIDVDLSSVSLERAPGLENPRWTVTAVATAETDVALDRAAVVAVFLNEAGEITGGARWQTPCLRPYEPTTVSVRQREALEDEHVSFVEVFMLPYGIEPQTAPTDPGGCP